MGARARSYGDGIRKASKSTAFLQAFVAILLAGLIYLMSGIYQRYEALQDGVRENAMWSVYQLDREARRLQEEARVMVASGDFSAEAKRSFFTRYDILYSRMTILKKANLDLQILDDPKFTATINNIEQAVLKYESWFTALSSGEPLERRQLQDFMEVLDPLVDDTGSLLVGVNSSVSAERADARDALQLLQLKIGTLTAVLSVCVGILVVMLQRQLRSVKSAARAFEDLAVELKAAYASADAGNRAKSQFMATMGHEVRTPLNAILGTAELLELSGLPDRIAIGVQTIRRSGETLLEIINEVLDYSKMENGHVDIDRAPADIIEVVSGVVAMMGDRAAERGNTLVSDVSDLRGRSVISTDVTRVRQVVLNLLSNALKFTSNGVVALKMTFSDTGPVPLLKVAIRDNGIGIDEAGLEKLFKPFSQVDASISRQYGGTGLGLTICKEIVEALGGTIGVSSEPGLGSTFWFEIPAEPAVLNNDRTMAAPAAISGPALPPLRVLLVEDNLVNQEVAAGYLAHLGQKVTVAGNGIEALAKVTSHRFDLVLMDMQMPDMDGIEATRRIRALDGWTRTVPIVALTGNASESDRKACEEAGMTDFQLKPINLAKLDAFIRKNIPGAGASQTAREDAKPGINERQQKELIEVLGKDGFDHLIDSFFTDAANILAEVSNAMRSGDIVTCDRMLHSLRGAASNVGLQEIADEAQRLRHAQLTQSELQGIRRAVQEHRHVHAA